MDVVVIVLLVLLGVIVLTKGKPLWNNLRSFNEKHPDVIIWILIFLIFGGSIYWGIYLS